MKWSTTVEFSLNKMWMIFIIICSLVILNYNNILQGHGQISLSWSTAQESRTPALFWTSVGGNGKVILKLIVDNWQGYVKWGLILQTDGRSLLSQQEFFSNLVYVCWALGYN